MRVLAFIKYDGSAFFGSAPQPSKFTVMGCIKSILKSKSIRFNNLVSSSRTDRGVHALRSSFHFDIYDNLELNRLKEILNSSSQGMFEITNLYSVRGDFHSRFFAKKRSYRYVFTTHTSPFERNYVSEVSEFDIGYMQELIKEFEGKHDFSYFKKEGSDTKTSIREIYKSQLYSYEKYGVFCFEGDGFLRSQVRLMVAFLLNAKRLGLGVDELKEQLNAKSRFISKPAPPQGLYLIRVHYDFNDL